MIRDKKMTLKIVTKVVKYIRCLVSTKWDSLFMDREFRAIGEYHHHLHLYLADCLTWRKLENTGYHPYLSTILRARIVGIACHAYQRARFRGHNNGRAPIGTQICPSLSAMTRKDKHVRQILYFDMKIHNLYDQSHIH